MKRRIDLLTLLFLLGSSTSAFGQAAPAEPDPLGQLDDADDSAPPSDTAAPDTAPADEPAGDETQPAVEDAAPEAAAELDADASVETAADATSAPPVEPSNGDIIVTGSRIKRTSAFGNAAPVDIIDRKQLEYSGATNLADVVQYLTVASGTGATGEGALPTGTSFINLRGLGSGATLVLLNGRRLGPSGGGADQHYEDLSIIPLAAVERLEILKGGGSAIYGADAVGGVVNIITRRNWNGVRVEGDALNTTKFDHAEYGANLAWGSIGERSRLMTAFGVFTRQGLTGADRDFTSRYSVSRQGNPATYIVGTTPTADPKCAMAPTSMFTMTGAASYCTFDFHKWQGLMGNLQRINAYASGEFDLTNHTTVFGELVASRTRTDGSQSPSFAIPPPLPIVPADHIDNPFGSQVSFLGRPLGAANGPALFSTDDDTIRVVGGFKGDFEGVGGDSKFATWEWEMSGGVNVSRYLSQIQDTLREPFQLALNSCSDPNDLSGCFNPFYSAIDGTGTPNSKAVIDSFTSYVQNLTDHGLAMYNAGMAGSLFELPGGDVGLAFGAEMRHEWRQSQEDHDSNQQAFVFLLGNSDAKAVRNIYSGYAELRWPFYDGIELQTAVRVEHYDDIKQTTPSPFAGLTLTPAEIPGRNNVAPAFRRLQLRGQVTSAFRAPTIYQSFPGFAVAPTLFTVTAIPSFVPVKVSGNPDLEPERALVISAGLMWQIIDEIGLSGEYWSYDYAKRIRPENSRKFVADYVANPMAPHPNVIVDAASGQIQRVDVRQKNNPGHIKTDGIDFGLLFTLTGATFGGAKSDWGSIAFGAQGTYTLNYLFAKTEAGSIPVPNSVPARTLPPPNCSGTECQAVGSRNVANFTTLPLPQWRVNFPLVFLYDEHAFSAMGHYISDLVDDNNVVPVNPANPAAGEKLGHVDGQFTFDLQYGYTIKDWIGKELTARIGMYNVLDAIPPSANATVGYEVMLFDPRGRMVYAKLISQF